MATRSVRKRCSGTLGLVLGIFGAALVAGCVSRSSGDQSRSRAAAALSAPDVWPARDEAWADGAAAVSVPRDVDWTSRDADGKPTNGKAELGNVYGSFMLMFGEGRIEAASRAGVGVVREIRRGRQDRLTEKERENSVNHFVSFTSHLPDGSCLVETYAGKAFRTSREGPEAKSADIHRVGLVPADMESQLALNQGMPFFLDPAWMHSKDFALPAEAQVPSRRPFLPGPWSGRTGCRLPRVVRRGLAAGLAHRAYSHGRHVLRARGSIHY